MEKEENSGVKVKLKGLIGKARIILTWNDIILAVAFIRFLNNKVKRYQNISAAGPPTDPAKKKPKPVI